MTLEFHPAVQRDFDEALDYYEAEGGIHLADRFEAEFPCLTAVKPVRHAFRFITEATYFEESD